MAKDVLYFKTLICAYLFHYSRVCSGSLSALYLYRKSKTNGEKWLFMGFRHAPRIGKNLSWSLDKNYVNKYVIWIKLLFDSMLSKFSYFDDSWKGANSNFFGHQNLTCGSFAAAGATRIHGISFESSQLFPRRILSQEQCLGKCNKW